MKILIVYATNSGGTREVAEIIRELCMREKNTVAMMSAHDAKPDDLAGYDLIVFGSCTWELITPIKKFEGQLHRHFIEFKDLLKSKEFPGKRFAVYALGDTSYTNFCIAANHLEVLVRQLKGTQVGPTLRINKFFYQYADNEHRIKDWVRAVLQDGAKKQRRTH